MTGIRNAAAGIVFRGDGDEVLLCKRNAQLKFMPGSWVFPGGRIDDQEGTQHVVGADDEQQAVAIHAACREIFEESGLLCVEGRLPSDDEAHAARLRVLENPAEFDVLLNAHGLSIHAADFEPAGVWTTPPMTKIRFHTRYYMYRYRGPYEPRLVEGEMVDLGWVTPAGARREWHEGRRKLPHPVAFVLKNLADENHPDVMGLLRQTSVTHDPKFGRIEFSCGINVLALESTPLPPATHTNCILLGARDLYVIDPGTDEDHEFEHLSTQIDHHLVSGGRVAGVLLTHGHRDHIGAAPFLREKYGAPVFAHPATTHQFRFEVDQFLHDGEIIDVAGDPGWRIKCLFTPGHDPGHVAFLEETTKTLLAGDMVAQMGTVIVAPRIGGNMQDYLDSLQKLKHEDIRMIIPAHGFPIHRPREHLQEIIDHRLEREQKLIDALEDGLRSMNDLIPRVYNDVDESLWPLAEQTLLAHLDRLGHRVDEENRVAMGR